MSTIKFRYGALLLFFCLFNCIGMAKPNHAQLSPANFLPWQDVKRIVVIVLENGNPSSAANQPYMKELSKKGAYLSQFYGVTHPSQPNYIAMIGGSTLGVTSDKKYDLSEEHLGDMLENRGKTWKAYAEGYPGNCYLGERAGNYARKHVPFLSFTNVSTNAERCKKVVPATEFDKDVINNALPTYSFFVPDLLNDGHNTGLAFADRWLKKTFAKHFNNAELMKDTLFVLTFDEDDSFHWNRIYTVLLGAGVQPGFESKRRYDHYSLLRTIEDIFELDDLGRNDLFAEPIMDIWR